MATTKELAESVLNEKNLYLLPENIKKDIQIFDITGTYVDESSPRDVRIFSSINEMKSKTGSFADELAIVYDSSTNNYEGLFIYHNNSWERANTGHTATAKEVVDTYFQGENGVERGILQLKENVNLDLFEFKVQVFNEMSNLTLNGSVTNISGLFANRTDLVSIPFINLSNVTNMTNTFLNCNNLSDDSYAKITNMLPNAANLTSIEISDIGLNISNFTPQQQVVLNLKGYNVAPEPGPLPKLNYYEAWIN